jgi:hypothetical protein
MSMAYLDKARLVTVDNKHEKHDHLEFLFNPTSYSVSKAAKWNRPTTKGATTTSTPEFAGTDPASVQMEVLFDRWEPPHKDHGKKPPGKRPGVARDVKDLDVSVDVRKLFEWLKPTRKSHKTHKPQPPVLQFQWGTNHALSWFTGYLKSVNAKYTMFWHDGTPTRATVTLTLEEVPTVPKDQRQNPTSGGVGGHRTHVMTAGDSLQSIAYTEYGDATLWRGLAELNGIDDPLRVPTGTGLAIGAADDTAPVMGTER